MLSGAGLPAALVAATAATLATSGAQRRPETFVRAGAARPTVWLCVTIDWLGMVSRNANGSASKDPHASRGFGQMRALDAVPLLLGCCAADGIDDGTGGGDADGRRRRKSGPSQ